MKKKCYSLLFLFIILLSKVRLSTTTSSTATPSPSPTMSQTSSPSASASATPVPAPAPTTSKKYPDPPGLPKGAQMVMSFLIYKGGPTLPIDYKLGNFDKSTSVYDRDYFQQDFTTTWIQDISKTDIYNGVLNSIADNIYGLYGKQEGLITTNTRDILHLGLLVVPAAKPNVTSAEKVLDRLSNNLGITYNSAIDKSVHFDWSAFNRNTFFPQEKKGVVGILDTEDYYLYNFGYGVMRCKKYTNWSNYTNTKVELLTILKEDFSDVVDHWLSVYEKHNITAFYYRSTSDATQVQIKLDRNNLYNNFVVLGDMCEQFLFNYFMGLRTKIAEFTPPGGVDRIKLLRSFILYDVRNYSMIHSALMSNPFLIFVSDMANYYIDPTIQIKNVYQFKKKTDVKMFTFSITDLNMTSFHKYYNYETSFSAGRSYMKLPIITFGSTFSLDLYKYPNADLGYDVYYIAERTDFFKADKLLQTNTDFSQKIQQVAFNPPFTNSEKYYYCGGIPPIN